MKNIRLAFLYMFMLFIAACGQEEIGQTPTDNEAPQEVTEVKIENLPGGAKIFYTIPNESDISYVKAEYNYKGALMTNKSTVYKNFVMIEGFGSTDPVNVKLYTIDHSENASHPVEVTINPLTPPVYSIAKSFKYVRDFGGFKLSWDNPTGDEMIVSLLAYDENLKQYIEENAVYSTAKNGSYSFRGFDAKPYQFALYVRDKYYNLSDTVQFELTPIFETKLDSKLIQRITDIPVDNQTQLDAGNWAFAAMFNGVCGGDEGWHTSDGNKGKLPLYWTIDLGADAQLSRFKLWHRTSIPYGHQNIRTFEIWGATTYKKGKDAAYWGKGGAWETDGDWEKLGLFQIVKPSGDDPKITAEDTEAMNNGFEFMFPTEAKPVRYLRHVMLNNFTGGTDVHISEMIYWGDNTIEN